MQPVSECYRGREVRVFRLDRARVLVDLRARAHALLARRLDVLEVRIFGSLARGDAGPGSDADLFVVLRDGAPPFFERTSDLQRHFSGAGIGCDIIAYTESERATLAQRRNAFSRAVLDEGLLLAARDDPSAAAASQ